MCWCARVARDSRFNVWDGLEAHMAGLNHDFLLLPNKGARWPQAQANYSAPNAILLHDDLIRQFADMLAWIPSENPSNRQAWSGFGLNLYGPTAISGPGAAKAAKVFSALADLLSLGPPELELTGAFAWIEGELPSTGSHARVLCDRDEVLSKLRAISRMALKAVEPQWWLLHLGV